MERVKALASRTLFLTALFIAYVSLLSLVGVSCPIAYITGIKCPTCGVSRALISLLKLDIVDYLSYQPLALPLVISVWLMFNAQYFKRKRLVIIASLLVVALNFAFYTFEVIAPLV